MKRYESKSFKEKHGKTTPDALADIDVSKAKTVADVKEILEVVVEAMKADA